MTVPVLTKNASLDAIGIDQAGLHTGFPGTAGANEVSGGSYARQAISLTPAAGGARALTASASFAVPASTIKWVSYWGAGVLRFVAPNGGGTPVNFTVPTGSPTFALDTGHGITDGMSIVFNFGTPPLPFIEGTTYYARDITANSAAFAATPGGTAITTTAAPGYGCNIVQIVEATYAAADVHPLPSTSFVWPD